MLGFSNIPFWNCRMKWTLNIQYSLKTLQLSYLLASSQDDCKVFDCICILVILDHTYWLYNHILDHILGHIDRQYIDHRWTLDRPIQTIDSPQIPWADFLSMVNLSMINLQSKYCLSMVNLCSNYGPSIVYLWYISCLSISIYGLSISIYGPSMVYLWSIQVYLWPIYCLYIVYLWSIFCLFMVYILFIYGPSMVYIFSMDVSSIVDLYPLSIHH